GRRATSRIRGRHGPEDRRGTGCRLRSSEIATGRAARAESTANARRALLPSAELDLVTVGIRGGQPAANTELGGDRGGIRRGQQRLPPDGTVSRRLLQVSAPLPPPQSVEELHAHPTSDTTARH